MSTAPRINAAQCAEGVMVVRPAQFAFNEYTAASNRWQQRLTMQNGAAEARGECDALAAALRAAGVRVCRLEDTVLPPKPDAVFPNNWVSFHRDGTVVLYPLQAPNRRHERRRELLDEVASELGFEPRQLIDLSVHEAEQRFLEGTGSLVLDHVQRVAYACPSPRTDVQLVREWGRLLGYEPVVFDALDAEGVPIYHTNVMLAIGARWVVVCSAAIAAPARARTLERLAVGRELIDVPLAAMGQFAANILELTAASPAGGTRGVLALSQRALTALRSDPAAWQRLRARVDAVVAVDVPSIETVGGGSVRCMLAEVPQVPA
jgi:hypothetical protein